MRSKFEPEGVRQHVLDHPHVGLGQVGATQFGFSQVRPFQASVLQVGSHKARALQVGLQKNPAFQVLLPEIGLAQVFALALLIFFAVELPHHTPRHPSNIYYSGDA